MEEKTMGQKLYDELSYAKKNVFEAYDDEKNAKIYEYAEGYKTFIDAAKTEREAVREGIKMAVAAGFTEYRMGDPLKVGDKRYFNNRDKNLFLFTIGEEDLEKNGIRIVAAHTDSPRLDIKQNPLYEDGGMAFFKTH